MEGFAPYDIELLLQTADGKTLGKHNIKDEGSGTAQFPVGDAGQHRWAVRVVTKGKYEGDVQITETNYYSGKALAEAPIEHLIHPVVSDEAEKRQQQDAELRKEIARVEEIKAIVNGLPAPTSTRKGAIAYRTDREYEQTEADAFQVPDSGFVNIVLGNIGATGLLPVEFCVNRKHIVYAQGNHEIAVNFNATRKAIITAQNIRNNKRSSLAQDITPNLPNPGLTMLHWAKARPGEGGTAVVPGVPEGTRLTATFASGRIIDSNGAISNDLSVSAGGGKFRYISASGRGALVSGRPDSLRQALVVPATGYLLISVTGDQGLIPIADLQVKAYNGADDFIYNGVLGTVALGAGGLLLFHMSFAVEATTRRLLVSVRPDPEFGTKSVSTAGGSFPIEVRHIPSVPNP